MAMRNAEVVVLVRGNSERPRLARQRVCPSLMRFGPSAARPGESACNMLYSAQRCRTAHHRDALRQRHLVRIFLRSLNQGRGGSGPVGSAAALSRLQCQCAGCKAVGARIYRTCHCLGTDSLPCCALSRTQRALWQPSCLRYLAHPGHRGRNHRTTTPTLCEPG